MEATGTYNNIYTEYPKSTGTNKYILSGQSYEYYTSTKRTITYVLILRKMNIYLLPFQWRVKVSTLLSLCKPVYREI